MKMTPEEIFRKEFKGSKNFITPHVLRYGTITGKRKDEKHVVYEVSSGRGINSEKIYGLTILVHDPVTDEITRDTKNSECLSSEAEVEEYIKKARKVYKEGGKG